MNRDFVMFRIEQLPLVIFGITYIVSRKGIVMPFSRLHNLKLQNYEMTLLP